ncbi:MAG: hypothetical protein ABIE70_03745 [bacterium]
MLSRLSIVSVFGALLMTSVVWGSSVSLQLSGKGAVNDSTIKAGEPVSVDIYFTNDDIRTGITLGWAITSPDIKEITHVADSGHGLNERGDVKGYNGWEGAEVWDLFGMFIVESDWDGAMPDLLGIGALSNQKSYDPHELEKKLSFELLIPQAGTLVIDSAFYPPGGKWLYSSPVDVAPSHVPAWGGPYTYKVVK